jgi:hypothetical protein
MCVYRLQSSCGQRTNVSALDRPGRGVRPRCTGD